MSSFCCINLKNNNVCADFNKYNELAKELTRYALEHDIAVFFNTFDYGNELISSANMKDFIIISDSFLYKNCELLDNTEFVKLIESNDISRYRSEFYIKYKFFKDIINIIFKYKVYTIEIYITEDGSVDNINDFTCLESSKESLIFDLFDCVVDSANEYGNEFPNLKITVNND